jgi:glycosyltransferase involved in cell wall biosynthesis
VTRLSATIIAQDEERDLPDCIASVRGFCDEILVVDGGSRDRTREVAAAAGARLLERPFDDFARQHEFARTQARGEWILSIDADERASAELRAVSPGDAAAYALPFKNHFRGIWLRHGGFWPARLDAPMLHYTYDSLDDCLRKMDRYAEQAARMLHAQGVKAGAWEVALRPLWRFLRGYFLRGGFLDGAAGAAMAWARSYEAFHRYARLWELSRHP